MSAADPDRASGPRGFPSPFQAALLVLLGVFVASLVAVLLEGQTSPTTAVGLGTVFGLGTAALLGASHVPPPHAERLGLRGLRPAQLAALALLLPVALLVAELDPLLSTWLPAPDAAAYEQRLREMLPTGEKLGLVETVVVVVGLAPLVEEWLFRGVIQQGLVAYLGAAGGIFVTALLFALGHGGEGLSAQAWTAVVAKIFVLGLALGWVRHVTCSLFAAILLHAGVNGLGVLALLFDEGAPGAAEGHLPPAVLAAAALSVALGGWWLRRIPPAPAVPDPPVGEPTMLIFDAESPAPRCLRMFLLEKGLELPAVTVDVFAGENREPAFLAVNPAGQTPALRRDDGSTLAEAVAIAEYLEELHPAPPLIGSTPEQRAQTRQWWRRVELNVTEFIHHAYHYAEGLARFESRIPVLPEAAAGLKAVAQDRLRWLDGMFEAGPYLCGARFTAADVWLYVWLDFGLAVGQPFDRGLPHLGPWFERVAARPSAARSRSLLTAAREGRA